MPQFATQEPISSKEYAGMTPDKYFSENQILRLRELMNRVQCAEAPAEQVLSTEDYQELQALISAELRATTHRAAALLGKKSA